jgi:hypothetical protein
LRFANSLSQASRAERRIIGSITRIMPLPCMLAVSRTRVPCPSSWTCHDTVVPLKPPVVVSSVQLRLPRQRRRRAGSKP